MFFTAVTLLIQVNLWVGFFVRPERSYVSGGLIADDSVSIALNVLFIILAVIYDLGIPYVLVLVLSTFSQLITDFSVFYESLGTKANFNIALTRLDALFFTIGTLTTAGTGNIFATSETVRRIQTFQMALDFLLVAVAVALVLARLTGARRYGQSPSDEQAPSTTPPRQGP